MENEMAGHGKKLKDIPGDTLARCGGLDVWWWEE